MLHLMHQHCASQNQSVPRHTGSWMQCAIEQAPLRTWPCTDVTLGEVDVSALISRQRSHSLAQWASFSSATTATMSSHSPATAAAAASHSCHTERSWPALMAPCTTTIEARPRGGLQRRHADCAGMYLKPTQTLCARIGGAPADASASERLRRARRTIMYAQSVGSALQTGGRAPSEMVAKQRRAWAGLHTASRHRTRRDRLQGCRPAL